MLNMLKRETFASIIAYAVTLAALSGRSGLVLAYLGCGFLVASPSLRRWWIERRVLRELRDRRRFMPLPLMGK